MSRVPGGLGSRTSSPAWKGANQPQSAGAGAADPAGSFWSPALSRSLVERQSRSPPSSPALIPSAPVAIPTSHPEAAASHPARLRCRGTRRRSWGCLVWVSSTDGDGHQSRTDFPAWSSGKAGLPRLSVFVLPHGSRATVQLSLFSAVISPQPEQEPLLKGSQASLSSPGAFGTTAEGDSPSRHLPVLLGASVSSSLEQGWL